MTWPVIRRSKVRNDQSRPRRRALARSPLIGVMTVILERSLPAGGVETAISARGAGQCRASPRRRPRNTAAQTLNLGAVTRHPSIVGDAEGVVRAAAALPVGARVVAAMSGGVDSTVTAAL